MKAKFLLLFFLTAFGFVFYLFAEIFNNYLDSRINRINSANLKPFDFVLNKKEKSKIQKIASKITVGINGTKQGSGVIVKRKGNTYSVLTLANFLNNNSPQEGLKILTFDGFTYFTRYKNFQKIGESDLVLITFKSNKKYPTAVIANSNSINFGRKVYISGFSLNNSFLSERKIKILDGQLLGYLEENKRDKYSSTNKDQILEGINGGPILDNEGKLIGIYGLRTKDTSSFDLKVKINSTFLNDAIPIINLNYGKESFIEKDIEDLTKENNDKKNGRYYLEKAEELLFEIGKEKYVLQLSKKALEKDEFHEAYYYKAKVNYELENFKESLQYINKAISLEPRKAIYFNLRGLLYFQKQNYNDAIKDFNLALKINPSDAKNIYDRSRLKILLGNYDGALRDISTAIKLDPKNKDFIYDRAYMKFNYGDIKGAIKDISPTLLDYLEFDIFNLYDRGKFKEINGDFKGASKDYWLVLFVVRILKFYPNINNDSYTHQFIGLLKFALKDYEGAIEKFNKAVEMEPSKWNYFELANAKARLNKMNEAVDVIDRYLKEDPNDKGFMLMKGNAKYIMGEYPKAIEFFNMRLDLSPQNRWALIGRAYSKYELDDLKGACADYKLLMKNNKNKKIFINPNKVFQYDYPLLYLPIYKEINMCSTK